MLSRVQDPQLAANELNRHLFPNAEGGEQFPLGRVDPRKYVWSLIHTLKLLIEANGKILREVSQFRLLGLGILQAEIHGRWRTILAYCGDCGKTPLFLGDSDAANQHQSIGYCQSCPCDQGRLVCDACGSCSGLDCRSRGVKYETWEEIRETAKRYPDWRIVGRSLYPPPNGRTLRTPVA